MGKKDETDRGNIQGEGLETSSPLGIFVFWGGWSKVSQGARRLRDEVRREREGSHHLGFSFKLQDCADFEKRNVIV